MLLTGQSVCGDIDLQAWQHENHHDHQKPFRYIYNFYIIFFLTEK